MKLIRNNAIPCKSLEKKDREGKGNDYESPNKTALAKKRSLRCTKLGGEDTSIESF